MSDHKSGYANQIKDDLDRAIADSSRAIQIDPNCHCIQRPEYCQGRQGGYGGSYRRLQVRLGARSKTRYCLFRLELYRTRLFERSRCRLQISQNSIQLAGTCFQARRRESLLYNKHISLIRTHEIAFFGRQFVEQAKSKSGLKLPWTSTISSNCHDLDAHRQFYLCHKSGSKKCCSLQLSWRGKNR